MSFCRITGKARNLPKANYFPILPPISPGDARRFCRITGKSYGLPSHHFIPVVLTSFSSKKKCRVTNVAAELDRHHYAPDISYGKRKHIVLLDYRYVFPTFDSESEGQKELLDICSSKTIENERKFVYRIDDKRCNLVFPANFEAAVRDGDIREIMLAKDSDQILLRTKAGKNISLELVEYKENLNDLYEGEGPKEEVILERERELANERKVRKISKCSRHQLKNITQMFENKDNVAQNDEDGEIKTKVGKKKAKALKNVPKNVGQKEIKKIKRLMESTVEDSSKQLQDLIKPLLESLDWDAYEQKALNIKSQKSFQAAVTKKIKPPNVTPAKIKVTSRIGEIEKSLLKNTTLTGFECIPLVGCYKRPDFTPQVKDLQQFQTAPPEMMKKLENIVERFQQAGYEINSLLPSEDELFDVLQNIKKGNKSELNGVPGCQIDIDERRVFLAGEFIQTENGEIFCPGQAVVDKKTGKSVFTPGLTTFDPKNESVNFIAGMVMSSKDNQVHFKAGQIVNNEFYSGQTIFVNDEPNFLEGETIITPDGFRFVAGVYNEENILIPGKFMTLPNGEEKFIAGQMTEIFVSGQNVLDSSGEWKFVNGQTIIDQNNEEIFVTGITIQTPEGSKFVAGIHNEKGTFIPGMTKKIGKELKFFPGITIETKQGLQFCEGQMVKSENGEFFMPGKTEYKLNGDAEFVIAESIDQISFQKPPPTGIVIDSQSLELCEPSMSVFGNMIQTEHGIEFYPEKIAEENLPMGGKMIPGKLIKLGNETKFIPGIKSEDGSFLPGQVVNTPEGDEFVCGQLVETTFGPKFVPGRVITLKNGEMKFVPGVTDKNGRFTPGQIIETRAGPTFIPGQICYTEEDGERFVPGQVVDTERGPCFVPGRIVERDDRVTFIAGQIVETPDGFRFVAPDMKDDDDEFEFNLQGFLVTPEELALIKPQMNLSSSLYNSGELSIDAVLMRQLSEAGMSIGRQVETSGVDLILQSTLNRAVVEKFCADHGIAFDAADLIFSMMKTLSDEHKGKINPKNLTEKILELTSSMSMNSPFINHKEQLNSQTARQFSNGEKETGTSADDENKTTNDPTHQALAANQIINVLTKVMMEILKNEEMCEGSVVSQTNHHNYGSGVSNGQTTGSKNKVGSVYEVIANVLRESIQSINIEQLENTFASLSMKENVLEKLNNVINKVEALSKIEDMKQSLLSSLSDGISCANEKKPMPQIMVNDNDFVIEQFCDMVEDLDVSSAFSAMTKNNPKLMLDVLNAIQETSNAADPNMSIKEMIQKAIVSAVNETNNSKIDKLLANGDVQCVENILNEALLLAKVLGLNSEAITLLNACGKVSKSNDVRGIELDEAAKSVVRRVCVMRQLAEVDNDYREAFELLQQSPHRAVKDEVVRELVRKSGLISIEVEEKQKIETSNDIPMSLLAEENVLAMEDFMLRSGSGSRAFLIIKDGIQCVVPREKSHDVLTGKCAYTVLDENGIRHFEPLHVLSALKMNNHRFSMYANGDAIDELSKLRRSSCSPTYDTQTRDFQFSNCDFADQNDNSSSQQGDNSENGDFNEYFVEKINYDVDQETGYRRPRRRRHADKDDPTSNLDFQTTNMLRQRRGARADRKSKSPITTQVYRQFHQINDNIYIMHAYVYHSKDKNQKATR